MARKSVISGHRSWSSAVSRASGPFRNCEEGRRKVKAVMPEGSCVWTSPGVPLWKSAALSAGSARKRPDSRNPGAFQRWSARLAGAPGRPIDSSKLLYSRALGGAGTSIPAPSTAPWPGVSPVRNARLAVGFCQDGRRIWQRGVWRSVSLFQGRGRGSPEAVEAGKVIITWPASPSAADSGKGRGNIRPRLSYRSLDAVRCPPASIASRPGR